MAYSGFHTAFDVNKEFLIQGAELVGEYQIPLLPPINIRPDDTVDFSGIIQPENKGISLLAYAINVI